MNFKENTIISEIMAMIEKYGAYNVAMAFHKLFYVGQEVFPKKPEEEETSENVGFEKLIPIYFKVAQVHNDEYEMIKEIRNRGWESATWDYFHHNIFMHKEPLYGTRADLRYFQDVGKEYGFHIFTK